MRLLPDLGARATNGELLDAGVPGSEALKSLATGKLFGVVPAPFVIMLFLEFLTPR